MNPEASTLPKTYRQLVEDFRQRWQEALEAERFWEVWPSKGDAPIALFDASSGLRYALASLDDFLRAHPFLSLMHDGRWQATLHTESGLLWCHEASRGKQQYTRDAALTPLKDARWAGLNGWRLPSKDELHRFATSSGNPHRVGQEYRLAPAGSASGEYPWLTDAGRCDVDAGCWGIDSSWSGYLFACHDHWRQAKQTQMLKDLFAQGWQLQTPDGRARFEPDRRWAGLDCDALMQAVAAAGETLRAGDLVLGFTDARTLRLLAWLEELDYRPSRLPRLEKSQICDPNKGLWELWGAPADELRVLGVVARDPERDVRRHPVAIDFGTSSTVVAVYDGQREELLRIGARDFYAPIDPREMENPTVVRCLDYAAFMAVWQREAYRPALDWAWMRMGHEAREEWRENSSDVRILASTLAHLKLWAARPLTAAPVRLRDFNHGAEHIVPPLSERWPVRGQPLQVGADDPFDPIEYFAFQLGMAINWRNRGLHLKYYLSFPAKYERAVKNRILASFARGLQRSLPESLIQQGRRLGEFEVRELASEPAAYAAAALPYLGLSPTPEGLAYAVFDFGGGTTDFDFGIWRSASAEEEDLGYEQVFEHLASSGDNLLGGEHLLEQMAYRVFTDNLDALRGKRIHFTAPVGAPRVPGVDSFIQPTEAAQANMMNLIRHLRPFWEGAASEAGALEKAPLKETLLDADGVEQKVELGIDYPALERYLEERIGQGVQLFLQELARVFAEHPGPIHVLLAGNASRARQVEAAFASDGPLWSEALKQAFAERSPLQIIIHPPLPIVADNPHAPTAKASDEPPRPAELEQAFAERSPLQIIIHPPLPIVADNPHAPTAKTGVALGLLRLAPGRGVKVIHAVLTENAETPFRHFVGRLQRGVFKPALTPDTPYGEWQELGPISDGHFILRHTRSVRARLEMREGDAELFARMLTYAEAQDGTRLWARATAPDRIELALAKPGARPEQAIESLELH